MGGTEGSVLKIFLNVASMTGRSLGTRGAMLPGLCQPLPIFTRAFSLVHESPYGLTSEDSSLPDVDSDSSTEDSVRLPLSLLVDTMEDPEEEPEAAAEPDPDSDPDPDPDPDKDKDPDPASDPEPEPDKDPDWEKEASILAADSEKELPDWCDSER